MENDYLKSLTETMERQTQLLEQLAQKDDPRMQYKVANTVHDAIRLHGNGGVFTGPGLNREVITAMIRPYGLLPLLTQIPSVDENPRFASLTGVTDDIGAEPAHACDDAPTGYIKGCNLTARYGLLRRDTNTVEMDRVMMKINRGDFSDLVMYGKLIGMPSIVPSGLNESQVLNIITMAEMVSVGVRAERELSRQLWQGAWGTNTEFPGLDAQIATGITDADGGGLCPALDSDVKNFGYNFLSDQIVRYLSQLEWYLHHNADGMGLSPVNWVIVMRPDLWFELTAIWPCAYNTNRCVDGLAAGTNAGVFLDGRENTRDRDAMRQGMYLDINGRRYPVVVDTGIHEHDSSENPNLLPGEFASSIYMVPLTIGAGLDVTYMNYVDYRLAAGDISLLRGLEQFFWTDNGVFSWAVEQIKWCYKLALKTEQRVVLRTPQLAGRIDAIKYSPLQHLREPDPTSPYYYDGGVSVRPGLSAPTAVWASRAQ